MITNKESEPLLGGEDEQKEQLYPDIIRDAVTTDAGNTNSSSILLLRSRGTHACLKLEAFMGDHLQKWNLYLFTHK